MTIVEQILASVGMRKRQASFMEMLLGLWLAIPGRIKTQKAAYPLFGSTRLDVKIGKNSDRLYGSDRC